MNLEDNNLGSGSDFEKIFIGGTGRSGTTILAKLLGNHSKIYTFPQEIRFITDSDGFINLKNSLVDEWSYFQSDIAIERFLNLMNALHSKSLGRYPTVGFANILGAEFYNDWLETYINEFIEFEFKSNWVARTNIYRKIISRLFKSNRFAQFFYQNSYYCQPITSDYFYSKTNYWLSEFFKRAAMNNGKKHSLDHTPSNLIHAEFLHKIFPDFKLIHIYRDPRDVIASFTGREWGSDSSKRNLMWIENILGRWDSIKSKIPPTSYHELAFEQFIHDPEKEISNICKFLNIDYEEEIFDMDLSSHNIGRWKRDLNSDLISIIENSQIDGKYFFDSK